MPLLIYDFDGIRRRRDALRTCSTDFRDHQPSLRDLIERGSAWWPSAAVTDGADHFVLPSIRDARAASALSAQEDQP